MAGRKSVTPSEEPNSVPPPVRRVSKTKAAVEAAIRDEKEIMVSDKSANDVSTMSDMAVAYNLLKDVAFAEGRAYRGITDDDGVKTTRSWILNTFKACRAAVRGEEIE